jgi:flagellar hook-associated protein FlgK
VQFNTNDTIAQFVNKINNNVINFSIVFNESTGKFYMFGNDQFTVQEEKTTAGPAVQLLNGLMWNEETESAAPINSASSPTINQVKLGQTWLTPLPPATNYVAQYNFNTPTDYGSYANGIVNVTYNGGITPITWNTGNLAIDDLALIAGVAGISYAPNLNEQKIGFYTSVIAVADPANPQVNWEILPFTLTDKQGNLARTLNLPGTTRFGSVYATIVGQVGGQLASSASLLKGYQAAVDQYQNMQTEITHVNADQELAAAKMYQRAYDASVKLMEVIDEMLNILINRTGTSSSSISTS